MASLIHKTTKETYFSPENIDRLLDLMQTELKSNRSFKVQNPPFFAFFKLLIVLYRLAPLP